MSKYEIIGQSRVKTTLSRAVVSDRVSHAYLFHGPEGVGKRAMAIAYSAAVLCKEKTTGEACGQCNSCDRVFRLIHPDVHFLFPAPGDTTLDAFADRLKILGDNPYSTADFERRPDLSGAKGRSTKRVIYTVDRIHRDVHRALSFAAVEGGYRVVIISDAHRMMAQAGNALLKILEEPRPKTLLILITDQPDILLPTIRSRCQAVRFDRLSTEEISAALVVRNDFDPGAASSFATMADGSFTRALDLALNPELVELRNHVVKFMRTAYSCKGPEVVSFAEDLQRLSREQLRFFYQLLLIWLRDILLVNMLGEHAFLVNVDQAGAIRKFAANLPHAKIDVMIEAVEDAQRLVERNVNPRLGLIALSMTLADAMRGEAVDSLVVSLSSDS